MLDTRNLVALQGGLPRDPSAEDGKPVRFTVAVDFAGNDRVKADNKSGYFEVVVFSNQRESYEFAQKLKQADRVSIVGALRWSRWESDGSNRTAVEVVAEHVRYAPGGAKKSEAASSEAAHGESAPAGEEKVAAATGGFVI